MRSTLGSANRQASLLPALVACAVLTITSSPTRGETTIEAGFQYSGADLKALGVADVEQCRQACEAEALCKAYTFLYSGQCFLKSSVLATIENQNTISGLKGGWRSGPFHTWVGGGDTFRTMPLEPKSTDVCVLTRVSGKFVGGGESVRVIEGVEDRWFLEVASHQDEAVSGTAYCFKKSRFTAMGPERLTSPLFEAREGHGVRTWNGDAATFLAGVSGHLRGGGEHARIVQSQDGSTPSELGVGSASGYLKAWALSFFAGTAGSGLPAKFSGGEFKLDHVNIVSPRQVDMAPIDSAMCYFTRLQGKFDGGGEWAEIVPAIDSKGVRRWRLRAQARGESEVFAAARCYLRRQFKRQKK